jgi:hypothetical protein
VKKYTILTANSSTQTHTHSSTCTRAGELPSGIYRRSGAGGVKPLVGVECLHRSPGVSQNVTLKPTQIERLRRRPKIAMGPRFATLEPVREAWFGSGVSVWERAILWAIGLLCAGCSGLRASLPTVQAQDTSSTQTPDPVPAPNPAPAATPSPTPPPQPMPQPLPRPMPGPAATLLAIVLHAFAADRQSLPSLPVAELK